MNPPAVGLKPAHSLHSVAPKSFKAANTTQKQIRTQSAASHPTAPRSARYLDIITPQPFAQPALPKQQPSRVLKRQFEQNIITPAAQTIRPPRHNRLQALLVTMGVVVFAFGIGVSIQTALVNRHASAQVAAISKAVDNGPATSTDQSTTPATTDVPSTTKPAPKTYAAYSVAPDLPKYIKIPKLGVSARVLQVGINSKGELGTPNNVFDAAWYTGSAKPGQPGATLIDGHVSSWTTHGVFYGIKNLVAGDRIQIIKGDNTVLTYQVVQTQIVDADKVDMNATVNSIDKSKSGLNLITCTGRVKPGTSEFTQRAIVYAVQL
jgi:LPXTG-site transpeptidase (sortase) family protein